MAQISVNYPQTGQPNSTEDPKIATALSTIVTAVNALDDANLVEAANINGSKLLNASIAAAKLTTDSVETAKIVNDAVTNDKIADDAVDTAQIADGAVTNAKVTLTHETGTITYNAGYSASSSTETGPLTITKNAEGMVFISGGITRTSSFSVGGIVGTLPEGFRPAAPILLWAVNPVTGVTTSLQLLANGQLKTLYSSSTASGTSVIATSFYAA